MTFPEILSTIACGCSIGALIYTALQHKRGARWRETDEAKALVAKVDAHARDISLLAQAQAELKDDINKMPTRADFEKLAGAVTTLTEISKRTEKNVDRLVDSALEHAR